MINSRSYATALLTKQFKGKQHPLIFNAVELNTNPDSQFSIGLVDDNIFKWDVCFEGPPNTLYEVTQ